MQSMKFTYVNPDAKPLWMKIHYESLYYFGTLWNDRWINATIMSERLVRGPCTWKCRLWRDGVTWPAYISGQGRTRFARTGASSGAAIAGKCKACERSGDWKRSRYRGWETELAAHSVKTIRDNKGDGRKLIPNSESVDVMRHNKGRRDELPKHRRFNGDVTRDSSKWRCRMINDLVLLIY